MGTKNAKLVYYSASLLLSISVIIYGFWLQGLVEGECTDAHIYSGARGAIVVGSILTTISIGIWVCILSCKGHGGGINPLMVLLMAIGHFTMAGFIIVVLSNLDETCVKEKKDELELWCSIGAFLSISLGVIGLVIIFFGRDPGEARRQKIAEKRKQVAQQTIAQADLENRLRQDQEEERQLKLLEQQENNLKKLQHNRNRLRYTSQNASLPSSLSPLKISPVDTPRSDISAIPLGIASPSVIKKRDYKPVDLSELSKHFYNSNLTINHEKTD